MNLWPAERTEAAERFSASSTGIIPYQTGLSGRPTSWGLIQAECKRRYAEGERYKTHAEWARVLISWLQSAHREAPAVQPKTLTNKLGGLLRELKAVPLALDHRRPK